MLSFKEYFLIESFENVFDREDKLKYVDDVWNMLQKSYSKIGGLKGAGFGSKEDMMNYIWMWKIATNNGKPVAVVMYKNRKGMRKGVAAGTDGTPMGKNKLKEILREDFERSFSEVSGPLLKFLTREFPDLVEQYKIPVTEVKRLLQHRSITPIDDYYYTRYIGGHKIKKLALGSFVRARN